MHHLNLLCEIYAPSVYHHIPSGNRLGGIWEASGRHLEPSGGIWKHFEVPGGEEGDSGGFEIDFCLKIVLFLAKNHENLKKPVCLYAFVLKSRRFARSFYRKWSFYEAFLKVGFTKYQFLHGPTALRSSVREDM